MGLTQFFLHPLMAAIGLGLISVPIIIHLLNRLQYRKVRFAAMEFLLLSQMKNRRRILLEQLLLLLLRILIVAFLTFLFARLILNPSQLSLLEKVETHHLIVLDDSGSMQDRWAETTAFAEGLEIVKRIASELSNQEGLQTVTLLKTSQPDRTVSSFTQRQIDVSMISELEDKLETMQRECSFGQTNWPETFAGIQRILLTEPDQQQVVHLISDFRSADWAAAGEMSSGLESLATENVTVNLVPAVSARHENLAVTGFSGQIQTAAVRVPIELTAEIANYGKSAAENLTVRVLVDGEPIPQSITIPSLAAGAVTEETFEVVVTTAGEHTISVQIPADALEADNSRYLTLNVPEKQRVLIIDGTEGFSEALYVADALSADASITGIDVVLERPENLRNQSLESFTTVYLLNVPLLAGDVMQELRDYLEQGGGVAWFLGDRVDASFYRQMSAGAESNGNADSISVVSSGLFPVPIATSPSILSRPDDTNPGADLVLSDHPLFEFLNAGEGLLAYYVNLYRYYEVAEEGLEMMPETATVIGRLRNQSPLFIENQIGNGRLFVALTSVGPMSNDIEARWHNWPIDFNAPGFTVFHLELVKYLGSRRGTRPAYLIGENLTVPVNSDRYLPDVRIDPPEQSGQPGVQLAAKPEDADTEKTNQNLTANTGIVRFPETRFPGIYRVTKENLAREPETELFAFNVPTAEGQLEILSPADLRNQFGQLPRLLIQDYGELAGIQRSDPGKELRTLLLVLLVLFLTAEQLLAYRLSFHQRGESKTRPQRTEGIFSAKSRRSFPLSDRPFEGVR